MWRKEYSKWVQRTALESEYCVRLSFFLFVLFNLAVDLVFSWQVNVELVKDLLANQSVCKVCWVCKEALGGLLHQKHPVEIKADIQNLVDAQITFSPDEENLLSLSEAMEQLKHVARESRSQHGEEGGLGDAQAAFSPDEENQLSLSDAMKQLRHQRGEESKGIKVSVHVADWTDEDWDHLQSLLRPPDWD